jgi:hypothetical protein
MIEVIWIAPTWGCIGTWGRAIVEYVTCDCIQVDSPVPAGYASISAVEVKIWMDKGLVRAEWNLGGVRNLEGAN